MIWYHLDTFSMHFDDPIRKSVSLTLVEIHHYGRNRQKICQCAGARMTQELDGKASCVFPNSIAVEIFLGNICFED